MIIRACEICKKTFETFNFKNPRRGVFCSPVCSRKHQLKLTGVHPPEFRANQMRERRIKIRNEWLDILARENLMSCAHCGYNQHFCAIDFHHPDRKTKDFSPAVMLRLNPTKERIEALKKLIPLCSNCHRVEHFS